MLLYPNIITNYMAFKLLYFYILAHSAQSYGAGSVPVSSLKLVTKFIQNMVCKSTPKVTANVQFCTSQQQITSLYSD